MDILKFHRKLIENYKSYIQSFINIKDQKIDEFVNTEIHQKKLWPEPLVQFNPTFQKGKSLEQLGAEGIISRKLKDIFQLPELYRHQEEAIRLGAEGKEFIVTSGTGSGKSLTYIATIFDSIIKEGDFAKNKTLAVIVYPMNALINSQYKAIDDLRANFSGTFPVTFGQYTGQEDEETRQKMRDFAPNILLTNYMMLELIMTRGGKDLKIREGILQNIKYLVFDELHTYRGRQGSDVSILIRRIKAGATNKITCIGTSATMVSSEKASLFEQRQEVAEIGSTIFGSDIKAGQVVGEYLIRSIGQNINVSPEITKLSIELGVNTEGSFAEFEQHALPNWIEEYVALEKKEGILVRRKPVTILEISLQLSKFSSATKENCQKAILDILVWANKLNSSKLRPKNYLPYRIHQFIAQTGSVYATLGNQESRQLFLNAGLYADNKDIFIFPLVFSRSSGYEFYCANLDEHNLKLTPREFYDVIDNEEDEVNGSSGYIFIQHKKDEELIWDYDRDIQDLPESWFNPPRKNGTRTLKIEVKNRLPKKIYFDVEGNFSFGEKKQFEGWFITAPLLFDPTSGDLFDRRVAEWTKLMKLGGEGRSTATTVLSFETITQLDYFGESPEKQKLLSFTDNRQDASLQAGHFNDFVKVGQLRAAITKALEKFGQLDYTNIADRVFECLNIPQDQFAKSPATFPGPKKENADAFKDFVIYRLLHDLRRSWRVVLPNLEQCALLNIEYKYLDSSVNEDHLWEGFDLLRVMNSRQRKDFLHQIFDFFRKSYALSYSMLESSAINHNEKRIKEKLKDPWTLEDSDKIEYPSHIRVEKLAGTSFNLFTESGGYQSVFGRYIKNTARIYEIDLRGKAVYNEFIYRLLNFLTKAGWLSRKNAKAETGESVFTYQLKVDYIIWRKGDGVSIYPDLIKNRSYKSLLPKVNEYFKRFYQINFHALKPIEGGEHTGQINSQKRKERETEFREGKIGSLFCSPTMELGIDISDLSIVHMRNVPPSPANYAQRSGRAGRSGQAALVMVYCSNFSAHDRFYFKNPAKMVAGVVTAPRMDLINEELLKSHLHASIFTFRSIDALNKSIGDVVDKEEFDGLPLKQEISDALTLDEVKKTEILVLFKRVVADNYFREVVSYRKPAWFNDEWIKRAIDDFKTEFDKSLDRWRLLYKNAILQFRAANSIIENRIYAENHDKIREARSLRKQAERQMELLLNDSKDQGSSPGNSQSEFYPFRYLAAEGFLPGYNFTRLPIRSFLENKEGAGEFVSRPRVIALSEFGPRNVVYHDGAKYRVDRMILSETEAKLDKAKISPYTGYILMKEQYNYNVDPLVNIELSHRMDTNIHTNLVEMTETKAFELQRITCQEEERTRKGYEIKTYFSVEGGFDSIAEALVKLEGEKLLHIHSIPAARLVHINYKWRSSSENGYALNLKNGYWQSKKNENEEEKTDDIKRIKLFTSTTANALYIQPVKSLGLRGDKDGVLTLMYALKKAVENYFQVESNEIGANIMGDLDTPNILIYEASEGSLGILSQIVDTPKVFRSVMTEAFNLCFIKDGNEVSEEDLIPATYDDLLSYYNQTHHQVLNRNYIRESLRMLKESAIEVLTSKSFDSYDEQYHALQAGRDPNSSTEDKFLKHLYGKALKLPDEAQPKISDMFVRPDFLYKPNICIFCDGTPHDDNQIRLDDYEKRKALKEAGYQVLFWYYKDSLDELILKRPDIFKPVK